MLDDKDLSPYVKEVLTSATYELLVNTYDRSCSICPFNLIRVVRNGQILKEGHNLQDAIRKSLEFENSQIERFCNYNEELHTLREVAVNTCRLWGDKDEYDEGVFIEIENVSDLKIDAWNASVSDLQMALLSEELKNQK